MKKISIVMVLVLLMAIVVGCEKDSQAYPVKTAAKTSIKAQKIDGTISVSLGYRYTEEAAKKFEKLHPGVKVEFRERATGNAVDEKSYQKTLNRMNTELMSGQGPDIIIILSRLPYKKYTNHHMLVDLSQLMKSDPNYDGSRYYQNIFDALYYKNSLYTLPLSYSYTLMGSDTKLNIDERKWNWQDLASTISNDPSDHSYKYALTNSDELLFQMIVAREYSHFVNDDKKSASFNSEECINLLKMCKELADKGYIMRSTLKPPNGDFKTLFKYVPVSSLYDLAWTQTSPDPDLSAKYLYRYPSMGRGDNVFQYSTLVAINNASSNKDTAWEFIKFLISDGMQSSPSLGGFPVNKLAYKQMVAYQGKQFCQDKNINLPKEQKNALIQKYARFNEEIVSGLNVYSDPDTQILEIVSAGAKPYFTGNVSAESVAQSIQNKVDFYLKE